MIHKKAIKLLDKIYLKDAIKKIVNSLHIHVESDEPDIFIFSTPRSGSTLLFDLIALNPKIKAINEPLSKGKEENLASYISNLRWRYASLSQEEQEGLKEYFDWLMNKKMSNYFNNPDQHHWYTNRSAIKCLRAPGIIDWFYDNFNIQAIYLVRHPIPSILSRIRNGWNLKGKDKEFLEFYESEYYQSHVLSKEVRLLIKKKQKQNSVFGLQIIMWCFENIKVLKNLEKLNNLTFLTYEELTLKSEAVIDLLCEQFNLPNVSAMKEALNKPSNSSRFSKETTIKAIQNNDKRYLLEKWKSEVSQKEVESTCEILEAFGIDIYNGYSILPNLNYTKFLS